MTMLDRMRRHKGWLKWFLAVVAVALCLYLIPDFLGSRTTTTAGATNTRDVLAQVGDRTVTVGEFDGRYQNQLDSYRQQFGGSVNESMLRRLGIEQQVLRQLIEEQLGAIEAERQGIHVSDGELATQIVSMPIFQENGQFIGDQRYRQVLQSLNPPLNVAQFETEMRKSMALERLRSALTDWMTVTDDEVDREYKLRNEKVKMLVVALNAAAFRDKVMPSDAEVAAHFESHKDDYRVGEQRKITYFQIDRNIAKLKVSVTPNEVQREYNLNLDSYHTPEQVHAIHILLKTDGKSEAEVRTRAEAVLKQVKAGEDFAALARKVSEDEGSKDKGGDLGFFPRGQMVPEFDTAVFAMKPGETSELVKSQFGFHIIRLLEKKPDTTRPLDEVRNELTERLTEQKTARMLSDQANRLAGEIKSADDLARGASEAGTKVVTSDFFDRMSAVPGIGVVPQVNDAAFGLADKKAVAGPIETPGGVVFLALADRKDPYLPKLDEVKSRVREDVIRLKATELSRQRANDIAATLAAARDFSAAAKTLGLEAKETALVSRNSPLPDVGTSADVDKVVFALPLNGVSKPIPTADGSAIIKVTQREDVTPEKLQAERETFRAQLLNERRDRFFSAYMMKAKDKTKVEVHNDVMQRVMAARGA